jgi:UDPglucose--hexose-1-phosphate uridylyltransferase
VGRSEVVIETARHVVDPLELTHAELTDVFRAYRDRLQVMAREQMWSCAAVFKNVGAAAGASLPHTHSQIIALPLIPPIVAQEMARYQAYKKRTGRCLTCEWLQREQNNGQRIVAQSDRFVVVTAYAPRFPYELWLTSRHHYARFEELEEDTLPELSQLWRQVLAALGTIAGGSAYNWVIVSAPWCSHGANDFHWRLELLPRLACPAGLEWGYGCFISSVTPETAAQQLRTVAARNRD